MMVWKSTKEDDSDARLQRSIVARLDVRISRRVPHELTQPRAARALSKRIVGTMIWLARTCSENRGQRSLLARHAPSQGP